MAPRYAGSWPEFRSSAYAIETVLAGSSYREHAAKLSDAIASREGCIDVIASLERLADE